MDAKRRLFFALWPEERVRARVAEAAAVVPCGGKEVPRANYHITLVFLGDVPAGKVDCLCDIAGGVHAASFLLTLDRFGHFPGARAAWLGPSRTPPELSELYQALAEGLPRCGLAAEARPYHPHLTLARKAMQGPDAPLHTAVVWPVNDFVLVESEPTLEGSSYRVLRRWPLMNEGLVASGSTQGKEFPPRS